MATLQPGRRAYLNYGERVWHERLILAHVAGSDYIVASPDLELFAEQMDSVNPDLEGFRIAPVGGGVPIGLPGDDAVLYQFRALTADEETQLRAEGADLATAERAARGIVAAPAAAVAGGAPAAAAPVVPAPAPAALVPVPPPPAAAAGGGGGAAAVPAPTAPAVAGPEGAWLLDEPLVGHEVGEEFTLPDGAAVVGDRALAMVGGEPAVLKRVAAGCNISNYARERRSFLNDDFRVIPQSEEVPTFAQAVREMTAASKDGPAHSRPRALPLAGPAVSSWWLDEVVRHGHASMIARHDRWLAESGVMKGSGLAYEHEVISRAVQLAAVYDNFNLRNSAAFEFLLRRLQLQEEAVNEDPSNPSYEGARHFLGVSEAKGGALVAPQLRAHVAAELGREAAIMKEKRKAREARSGAGGGKTSKGDGKGKDKKESDKP